MALENTRQDAAKPENQREKRLVDEYREVGPAAINAALLCKPKKKERPAPSYVEREDA